MHRIPHPFSALVFAACTLLSFASPASAQIVFVGPASDPDCNYETIQEAVDAWAVSPSTEFLSVFIANAQSYSSTAITIPTPAASSGISLRGDMPGCRLSGAAGTALLNGDGNGNRPVIDIDGGVAGEAERFEVTLSSLGITGGHHASGNGGGVRVRGNVTVTIFDTDVHGNTAENGGGVAVEASVAGTPHLIMGGNQAPAAFRDNEAAQDGGGLYCSDATMYCDRYCLVAGNHAGRNGGGVAQQACGTSIYPPTGSGQPDPDVGLRMNSAAGDGGGAWVSGGYFSVNGTPPQKPAPVVGNTAGGSGGGLYFSGLGDASNQQSGVQFDGNHAGANGGALFADSGFLQLYAGLTPDGCRELQGCPRFNGNHADLAGGAIALSGNASALISGVMFAENDAAQASVLQIGGAGAGATLTNVHVAGNHGAGELLHSSGAYVDLRYVTVADNGADDDALIRFDAPGSFGASNSLLYDENGAGSGVVIAAPAGTTFGVDCVLVHEDSGLGGQPGVNHLVVADPQWDTSGLYPVGLYGPGPDSPAVDACDFGTGTIPDLLGNARPQDLPRPDGAGPYDMGAIERLPDHIFADGFELP